MPRMMQALSGGIFLLVALSHPAFGCLTSPFDHAAELDAIRRALPGAPLNTAERKEISGLLRKASVDRKHLGMKGMALQDAARGQAMAKLGLARIPRRPDREFKAVADRLGGSPPSGEAQKEAARLRDNAERLWGEHKYEQAWAALTKAVDLLGITFPNYRC